MDGHIELVELAGFTTKETMSLYVRQTHDKLDETFHRFVEQLVKTTNGHPLKLELAITWADMGLLNREAFTNISPDEFDAQLMARVRQFGEEGRLAVDGKDVSVPVYQTILCMAYLNRRFNRDLLQHVIDQGYIKPEDGPPPDKEEQKRILKKLEECFFVKVRDTGDIQLHDELTRLVLKHLWPQYEYLWPWGGSLSKNLPAFKQMALQLYDTLTVETEARRAEAVARGDVGAAQKLEAELNALLAEQLHYTLEHDPEAGKQRFFDLAERLNEDLNKLLAGEIEPFIDRFGPQDQYEIYTRLGQIEANLQRLTDASNYYQQALKAAETLGDDEKWIHAHLALHNVTWQRSPKRSLEEYLWPALERSQARHPRAIPAAQYEIGFTYKMMQDIHNAVKWYERAKESVRQHGGSTKRQGIILNDLYFVYTYLGEYRRAEIGINEALKIRHGALRDVQRRLQELRARIEAASPEAKPALLKEENRFQLEERDAALFVGMSYSTLGEISRYESKLDTAVYCYTEALKIFAAQEDFKWQAKALFSRAEAHRRIALEKLTLHDPAGSEAEWKLAESDLEDSLYLCRRYYIIDERDTAHRRKGRYLHDRAVWLYRAGRVDEARRALDHARQEFEEGLRFATRTNDVLEEFENLTEIAFLANDLVTIAGEHPTTVHNGYIDRLSGALDKHRADEARLFQFAVFENLLQIEQGAYLFATGDRDKALAAYLEGFAGLASDPGYGTTRYLMHYNHLIERIESIDDKPTARAWCEAFIDKWQTARVKQRGGEALTLAQVHPDLIEWCSLQMLTRNL
ncbi:MAG: hypothetical protein M5R40_03830 [Anaerolineae bacterium]|nr:hypothetical protein [Anaerolineae bacterium]